MKFSIVIPTYNREKDLANCLDSVLGQTLFPSELIIIDDGNLPEGFIRNFKEKFLIKNCNFVFYRKDKETERKGLSESKNRSLDFITNEKFFVFDDDIVLDKDFCKIIMKVWDANIEDASLIGIGGIIKNRRKKIKVEKYFNTIFGISSKYDWDVNKIGFQVWNEEIDDISFGYYAHGGVCSLDLVKTREIMFKTFSGGRTGLEDVDFCLRSKNSKYHFLIEPKAQLCHYPSKSTRESMIMTGYKESQNRKIIFKTNNTKKTLLLYIWFYWANIGWILRQFLSFNFSKGIGMLKGFLFN